MHINELGLTGIHLQCGWTLRNKRSTDLYDNHDGVFLQAFPAGDAQEVGVEEGAEAAREQEDDAEHYGCRGLQEIHHLWR